MFMHRVVERGEGVIPRRAFRRHREFVQAEGGKREWVAIETWVTDAPQWREHGHYTLATGCPVWRRHIVDQRLLMRKLP